MSKRVWYVIGMALLVLAAAGAYHYWSTSRVPAAAFRLAKVDRGTITAVVSATGVVNPVTSVQVGSQVSGQLKEILVDFNSEVGKGQVIARLDPESFRLRVNQAMADVEAARATVLTQRANVAALSAEASRARVTFADTEREYERNRSLAEKSFISTAVLDKSRAAMEAARESARSAQAQLKVGEAQVRNVEAVVKQREAQLAQAKVDLDRTTIRAPVNGIVIKRSVEPGQTVAASLQAPELFVIAQDLRQMQVEASIDEAEVGRIREDQRVTFTVDSFPGRTFSGRVGQVRKAATVVQNVVTYTAVIATSNADLSLFPGMTANVRIVTDVRRDVVRLPNAALRFRPAGMSTTNRSNAPASGPAAAGDEPAAGKGAEQGNAGRGEALRAQLAKELGLNAEQQARLATIMRETQEKIRAITDEDPAARKKQAARLRAESRERIAEMLTPEQRSRYEQMAPARGRGRGATTGRVWVVGTDGKPLEVSVRLGLADGSYTELLDAGLKEGAEVIVGTLTPGQSGAATPRPAAGPRFGL